MTNDYLLAAGIWALLGCIVLQHFRLRRLHKRLAWLEMDYRRHLKEGKVSITTVGGGGGGGGTGRYSAQLKDVETSGVPVRPGSVQIFEQDLGGNTRKLWPPEPPANS